jgi:hypothetical protein
MAYWEVIITSYFLLQKSIQYGNIIYVSLAVPYAFLLLLVVATAFNTARRQQLGGCASYGGLKRYIRLHWQITIHLVVCIKHAVVGLLGHGANLQPSGGAMGRSYNHREGYKGDSHQLGNSQRCSFAILYASNIWYIRQLDSLQIVNLHAGGLTYCSSAFRQLGNSTDRQLGRSTTRQLGSSAAL